MSAHQGGVVGRRIEACANRRCAKVDLLDEQPGLAQPLLVFGQHHGVRAELLAERHRHGILKLGAAHLEHIRKFGSLRFESAAQVRHRGPEPIDLEP